MANLSGAWVGTYWQQGIPTRFEMTLLHGGNTVSGNILDDSLLGEAALVGKVMGRSIHFTKRYLTSANHAVRYRGTISEDGDCLQGEWQVDFFDSGRWEAHRQDENLSLNLETRQSLCSN